MARKPTILSPRGTEAMASATLGPEMGTPILFMVVALTLAVAFISRLARKPARDSHKRGVMLIEGRGVASRRRRQAGRDSGELKLAGVGVPFLDETKHFKMVGTTGTGKSSAIRQLLAGALARGDRVLFADPDAGYRQRFFNRYRGDIVLNPFDPLSVRWDPYAEIGHDYDVDQLAAGLIPSSEDASSNEWRSYARTFLAAVIRRSRAGQKSLPEVWRILAIASVEEVRALVEGTPAQPFLELDNARMFGSIRSVAVSAIAALEHVQAQRATPFAVREWVRGGRAPGALFITYKATQIAALRSMIATWVRLAIFEAMSGSENVDQHLWFVVDELDALGAIEGLKDALTRLRKFGGRCVLGFQSIAQVHATYGTTAQTLVENCGNSLILRCSGGESGGTSQFASRLIGDREVVRRQMSRGSDREGALSGRGMRRSKNISDSHVTEAAIMPSQLEQLPDLSGYLKLASSSAWRRVEFSYE